MGYCVDFRKSTMKIKKDKMKEALKLLVGKRFCRCDMIVDYEIDYDSFDELNDVLYSIRYEVIEEGDYYLINEFYGEKLGDDRKIFDIIAKYCKEGGYVEFLGEDGDLFRFVIRNGECVEEHPNVSWS